MDKSRKHYATNGTAGTAAQAQTSGPYRSAPASTTVERQQDPRETAQEAFHQVTPKGTITGPFTQIAGKNAVIPPLRAAKGDDDVMSQPPEKKS